MSASEKKYTYLFELWSMCSSICAHLIFFFFFTSGYVLFMCKSSFRLTKKNLNTISFIYLFMCSPFDILKAKTTLLRVERGEIQIIYW